MQKTAPRIALVRLSALGDIVNSVIALQMIRHHIPDARITWVCESAFAPLLANHPLLDNVIAIPLKQIKKEKNMALLRQTLATLRHAGPYDHIIDMQGLLKSAITARLLGSGVHGFSKAASREGAAAFFYATTSNIPYETNIIRRNCGVVGDALGFTCKDDAILSKAPLFAAGPRPDSLEEGTNIAMVIGASWPSKQYPKEQCVQVCRLLHHPVHLVWGNDEELERARWIASECSNARVAPKMDLASLVTFIAHCDLIIGNDTGPTHMAWAMNRPSIVLFGPTTPRMMYETPINLAIESDSHVMLEKIDKNDFSIATIEPEQIAKKAESLL